MSQKQAYIVDYAVQAPDGEVSLDTVSYSASSLFAAAELAKDMVEDYKREFPSHEVRVWNVGLAADCAPEDLFDDPDAAPSRS